MGTSTPFGGGNNNNPLIPSWLDDPSSDPGGTPPVPPPPPATPPAVPGKPENPPTPALVPSEKPVAPATPSAVPAPAPPIERKFTPGRTAFNKGARSSDSGDRERSFRNAAGSYVRRATGGARGATTRARVERQAAGKLASLLIRAGENGSDIRQELRKLSLDALASRSLKEIYEALIDYVCEPGGDLDQAFVRDAYAEAVDLIPDTMTDRLERPDAAIINFFLENFITNTIMARLLNAVGNGAITLPKTANAAKELSKELRGWIHGRVQDAMHAINGVFREGQVLEQINQIYFSAYSILESEGDEK